MSRTLVVGDIHGCAREFGDLLDGLAVVDGDSIVLVGDLVAKGPASCEVLAIAREVGAVAIRGNHEARLLQWRHRRNAKAPSDHLTDLARGIDEEGWEQIEAMPLWVKLPQHDVLVVHAGLVPGRPVESQDEHDLLHMRCIDETGRPDARRPPPGAEERLWGHHYAGSPHVVFGHNAMDEPQLHPAATGLDTGCVYGGRLTALILAKNEHVAVDSEQRTAQLFSVPARESYVPLD